MGVHVHRVYASVHVSYIIWTPRPETKTSTTAWAHECLFFWLPLIFHLNRALWFHVLLETANCSWKGILLFACSHIILHTNQHPMNHSIIFLEQVTTGPGLALGMFGGYNGKHKAWPPPHKPPKERAHELHRPPPDASQALQHVVHTTLSRKVCEGNIIYSSLKS